MMTLSIALSQMAGLAFWHERAVGSKLAGFALYKGPQKLRFVAPASASLIIAPERFGGRWRRQRQLLDEILKKQFTQPSQSYALSAPNLAVEPFAPAHERAKWRLRRARR